MSAKDPLVSVITPVYNGERYLAECMQSVLDQTYERWEHVVVDNCSTDGSRAIALELAQRDDRVRVEVAEEFLPQIPNWNRALRAASPESRYYKVLHADDWLFPECLERMVAVAEQHPSAGIVGAQALAGKVLWLDGLPADLSFAPGVEICRHQLLGGREVLGSPTSTLLRAEVVRARDPLYDEALVHADTEACLALLRETDFGFVHEILTFTRSHEESFSTQVGWVGTWLPDRVVILLRHGPHVLSRGEYAARVRRMLGRYAAYLVRRAGSLALIRDPAVRNYHAASLLRMNDELRKQRDQLGLAVPLATAVRTLGRRLARE